MQPTQSQRQAASNLQHPLQCRMRLAVEPDLPVEVEVEHVKIKLVLRWQPQREHQRAALFCPVQLDRELLRVCGGKGHTHTTSATPFSAAWNLG